MKKKVCKGKNELFESVTIGKKKEKPMQTCKQKCHKEDAVACGFDSLTRTCTIFQKGGLKKIADATGDKKGTKFCGRLVEVEEEEIEGGDEVEEVTEPKCTLKARLGFPYDTPNGASHYGYHADMLDVSEATDDWWVCSWYYSGDLPEWCTYENSEPNGDSAYVANLDDQYEEWEELTEETVKVFNAAGKSYKFKVEHYYFSVDYYPYYENWEDHMNAATLWIDVTTGKYKGSLKRKGWQHPTAIEISTHIMKANGRWKVNPKYEGIFTVTVNCDADCLCSATYELP